MSHSELDTPLLPCGRTECPVPHDWVGGRCPGNKVATVIDISSLADEVRAALHAEGRAQAVEHLRSTADVHHGEVGDARRRGALNAAADAIRDGRAPGRTA